MTSEESVRFIGRAKAAVDNGFSRVGRAVGADDAAAAWLHSATGRAVALCDALIVLCRERHGAESASLARAVLQLAADMRWLVAGSGRERLSQLEREAQARDWGELWSQAKLRERLAAAGLPDGEASQWIETAARLCAGHCSSPVAGLPWAHAFPAPPKPLLSGDEALAAAARAMGEVVAALQARWPGAFAL